MTPGEDATTCRAGGLGRGRGGAKDPPKRLGKRSLEGTVCSVAKRAEDLHALRHKASVDSKGLQPLVTLFDGSYVQVLLLLLLLTTNYYYYYYYYDYCHYYYDYYCYYYY